MVTARIASALYPIALVGLLPLSLAHGHDEHGKHGAAGQGDAEMTSPTESITSEALQFEPSYFRYGEYQAWIWGHIATMVIAWCFILPIAVMFSVAKSRYTLFAQSVFLAANTLGVILVVIYRANVPEFYERNVHHRMGWLFYWFALAWVLMSVVNMYARKSSPGIRRHSGQPISAANMARYQQIKIEEMHLRRWSGDSGQGTERNSASLFGSRSSSQAGSPGVEMEEQRFGETLQPYHIDDEEFDAAESEKSGFLQNSRVDGWLSNNVAKHLFGRTLSITKWSYIFFERSMLIFGWFALTSGGAVFGGVLRGDGIFSGLAHLIKGSIFFWYGCLTLGRWMGAFADFGWAWNVKPPKSMVGAFRAWVPTGEFTESFVIFLYGITNVWLEHLGNAGGPFEPQDLEHISITILFAGGGLLGMLVESTCIRDLLMTHILLIRDDDDPSLTQSAPKSWEQPNHYSVPLNPMPGLVIMLLGLMMSSHTQSSMVSSMIHKMWGTLFVGFAMSRACTYLLLYLKPPKSYLPSRPPTEIVASFCLCAGGLMFIASTADIVDALEYNDLDAMFIFTVCMGLTAGIMAWETWLMALKGWAARKENPSSSRKLALPNSAA